MFLCRGFLPRRCHRRFILLTFSFILIVVLSLSLQASLSLFISPYNKGKVVEDVMKQINGGFEGVVTEDNDICFRLKLELWHPSMKQHFTTPSPLLCQDAQENWVAVHNGTFIIKPHVEEKHGNIFCEFRELLRKDDKVVALANPIRPFKNGSRILSDFFEVRCLSAKGGVYKNLHSGIKVKENLPPNSLSKSTLGLNILMLGFDSVSRLNWIRNLPKSYDYLAKELGAVVLEGYNIVGDGTPQALLPILTGKSEEELPESRRGYPHARTVDKHPWIWTKLKDHGYVTQWGEDGAAFGTFNYRMLGFHNKPVDHYMRPFYQWAEDNYYQHNYAYCLGSIPRHVNMLNWVRDFFDAYPMKPKFSFLFHSELSHDTFSMLSLVDNDVLEFLKHMKTAGHLDNTMLILMSDHGARFTSVRHSQQGKYEERLPFFSFTLPQSFKDKHPKAFHNLQSNAHTLTTPFDIYETFKDIVSFQGDGEGSLLERGISLFKHIPQERTCLHAHIEPHWCTCMDWIEISLTDRYVVESANAVVRAINSMTQTYRNECTPLYLDTIHSAVKLSPNERMLKFKQSRDDDGRSGDFSDMMHATTELYQVTITTKPGDAKYEATIKYETYNHNVTYSTDSKSLSRINRYGNQPHCIMDAVPHLRAYCYCKIQL